MLSFTQWAGLIFGLPIAVIVFLLYMQPAWTLIISKIWLGEIMSTSKILAVTIAIGGILILVNPSNMGSTQEILPLIFPIFAGIFLSLSYVLGRIGSLKKIHPITTTFGFRTSQTAWAFSLFPIVSIFVSDPSFSTLRFNFDVQIWLYLLLFSFFIGTLTGITLYKGLETVPASVAGVILLLEPVSATVIASILFNEAITYNILAGGSLILLANYMIIQSK